MTIKPFAIQGADLTLGGVSLQAGTTGVVIPGVTRAANFKVEEVNEYETDGANPDTFGSDPEAVKLIDNAAYLFRSGAQQPSSSYEEAGYSVQELDDGAIEEIYVEVEGVFTSADKAFAEAGNMWASIVADAKTKPQFDTNDWTQVAFRPKMRAGTVELEGGGNADLGSFIFDSNTISVESGVDIYIETNETGGPGESRLVLKPQDDDGGDNPTRLEGSYGVGVWSNITDGDNIRKWLFGSDGWLSFPGTFPSGAIGYDSDTGTLQLARSLGVSLYTQAGAWVFGADGSITFPDDTVQTTAYTGQGGSAGTPDLWIAAGSSPGGAAILVSNDGITWTAQDYMMSDKYIKRVAIGANKIVYLVGPSGGASGGDAIYYTNAPENAPALAVGTDSYGEGSLVYWEEINYLGGKFVAVGYYDSNGNTVSSIINGITLAANGRTYPQIGLSNIDYNFDGVSITITGAANTELNGTFILRYNSEDTLRTGVYDLTLEDNSAPTLTSADVSGAVMSNLTNVDGTLPIFAYSTDGVNWTYGDVDSEFGDATSLLEISDVAYDGTTYLMPILANGFDQGDSNNPIAYGPGAFNIADLTAPVGEGQWISGSGFGSLPGNGNNIAAYGDGIFFICDDQYTVWTGSSVNGWTPHDIKSAHVTAYGWEPELGDNDSNDVDSAVAGTVGLNQCWVATTNQGMVVSTTDQGDTFQFSIPDPITTTATLHDVEPAMLDFSQGTSPNQWEKITIAVAQGDDTRWNGTYYVSNDSGDVWVLYDEPNGAAISGGTWTAPSNPFNITLSQGRDLGAIHVADNACIVYSYMGNRLYRSTDLINWTIVSNNEDYSVDDIYYAPGIPASGIGDITVDVNQNNTTLELADKDLYIKTTGEGSDIYFDSDDDIFLRAHGDDIGLSANDQVRIETGFDGEDVAYTWRFRPNGQLEFPNGTRQTTAYVHSNINVDGGGAAVQFEQEVGFVDGGFSATRHGVADPVFNGGNRLTEDNQYNLNGGGA